MLKTNKIINPINIRSKLRISAWGPHSFYIITRSRHFYPSYLISSSSKRDYAWNDDLFGRSGIRICLKKDLEYVYTKEPYMY